MYLENHLVQPLSFHRKSRSRAVLPNHVHVMTTQDMNTFLWHNGIICKCCLWLKGTIWDTVCSQPCLATKKATGSVFWHTYNPFTVFQCCQGNTKGSSGLESTNSNSRFIGVTEFLILSKVFGSSQPFCQWQ